MNADPLTHVSHVVGLDLGKREDYAALAVLELREAPQEAATAELTGLHRWHLGTPYPTVVANVLDLLKRRELKCPLLVVDQSGPGEAVVDLFRDASAPMLGVSIGGGDAPPSRRPDGTWRVTKKDLVSAPLVMLNYKRLTFAKGLPFLEVLLKELANFRVKITKSANETFEAGAGTHDDLVLALALACWAAERCCGALPAEPPESAYTEISRAPDGVFLS
jgi:hypothetical protein